MVLWEFALKTKLELGAEVGNPSHGHSMRSDAGRDWPGQKTVWEDWGGGPEHIPW